MLVVMETFFAIVSHKYALLLEIEDLVWDKYALLPEIEDLIIRYLFIM